MKTVFLISVVCVIINNFANATYSEEETEVQESCCSHGQVQAAAASSVDACTSLPMPVDVEPDHADACMPTVIGCCQEYFKSKDECFLGMRYAEKKRCDVPRTETAKTCCEECSFGRWTGESQGQAGCGDANADDTSPTFALRSQAYHQCCLDAAKEQERSTTEREEETTTKKPATTTTERPTSTTEKPTTTTKKPTSTTQKPTTTTEKVTSTTEKKVIRETCKKDSCEQICNDESGRVRCQCNEGYRLKDDGKSCKDINECREAIDDVCTEENTVCHNTAGSFKCVPIKKREVGITCPPGFRSNLLNQVCDDINECQQPRPPCPKYLCENTIGGYKCAGKPGKPFEETPVGVTTPPSDPAFSSPKNDICPPGFRAGPDDECLDVDECDEHTDDCQRLSQYCINTHGGFFCQDHVSKRCAPGFKVNVATGICEDIDECEESTEVCKRSEVCINLAGAYNCKSKISTLPKLSSKNCQEGTRLRPGGTICEDIDECREGTHLCDQFQNCVNTYGGHECRCKNGFELDSTSGSCVDIDECALKLDNCAPDQHCLNALGTYRCAHGPASQSPVPTSTTTTKPAAEDYYYYDSDEDTGAEVLTKVEETSSTSTTTTTTPKPTTPTPEPTRPRPYPNYPYPNRPRVSTTVRTPARPERPRNLRPPTTSTTTETTIPVDSKPNDTTPPTTPEETPYGPPRRPERPTPRFPERPNYPERPEDNNVQPDDVPATPERPYLPTQPSRPRPAYPTREYPERPEDNDVQPDEGSRRPEYTPKPPDSPRRPTYPNRPDIPPRTNEPPREVTFEKPPEDPVLVETDKDKDGSYGLNTSDIPKDRWTNVIGRDKPEEPDFDVNSLHCLNGFERDAYGNCVDVNECEGNSHICSTLESCVNMEGGYRCECISGFQRDVTGWCVPTRPPTTTSTTTTTTTTTERIEVATRPRWRPSRPRRPHTPPTSCELGYIYNSVLGRCVDIDECAREGICAAKEDCVNQEGGYYCVCGERCRSTTERTPSLPPYEPPTPPLPPVPVDPYQPSGEGDSNIITVGAQYGQRGPRVLKPTFTRLPNSGAIVTSCPWGYKLTPDKLCFDIDECAKNASQCGPQQRCENFFGGYSCQCPAGHKLYGKAGCEDIDECRYGSPCSYNSKCMNTVGSYRCECSEGFRNSPSNEKVCVDVDECAETPQVCHQSCSNAWGSYRCYCKRGYRLASDNRTCEDVDECAEWGSVRLRGRLCGGDCVNVPGSYRCACPQGYRLADDGKSCIDIDECETGVASCAASRDPGEVCQNTRGSYHCHQIRCPHGYRLEAKHRCTRIQRSCPYSDWNCLQRPSAYSYNFITFVANIYLPSGSVDLFTMHGPSWQDSVVSFELRMIGVQASGGVKPADLRCFDMRPMDNVCVISLLCSLGGPQVAELELTMSLYQHGQFAGNAVARLIIIVSQYEF